MPKSPTASKREVHTAFAVATHQAKAVEALMLLVEQIARDSEVSKGILTRPFLGRLRWLVRGT